MKTFLPCQNICASNSIVVPDGQNTGKLESLEKFMFISITIFHLHHVDLVNGHCSSTKSSINLTKLFLTNWTDINRRAKCWWDDQMVTFSFAPHMCKKKSVHFAYKGKNLCHRKHSKSQQLFVRFALFLCCCCCCCCCSFFFSFVRCELVFLSNYWKMLWEVHLGNSQNTKFKQKKAAATAVAAAA